ncbi:hypothetical protein, partial [Pseudomonas syringae group genomosp. 7]
MLWVLVVLLLLVLVVGVLVLGGVCLLWLWVLVWGFGVFGWLGLGVVVLGGVFGSLRVVRVVVRGMHVQSGLEIDQRPLYHVPRRIAQL